MIASAGRDAVAKGYWIEGKEHSYGYCEIYSML